jgi:hypothetical protein
MTASEAWMLFGEGNGAARLEQMLARIGRYRRTPIAPGEDPVIGCVFIRDVCFFRRKNPRRRHRTSRPTSCRARATT